MKDETLHELALLYGLTERDVESFVMKANAILKVSADYPTLVSSIRNEKLTRREQIYLAIFASAMLVSYQNNIKQKENDRAIDGTSGQVSKNRPSNKGAGSKKGNSTRGNEVSTKKTRATKSKS
jgi:hypothetical protein